MNNIVEKLNLDESISVCFYIENEKVMSIGEKMEEIMEEAYMNGYNWEAFLIHYLGVKHPNLLEGLDSDSEAGMYVALYEDTIDNNQKADELIVVITDLVNNPNKIYSFLKEEGDNIEWD
jgi:hypothetical protein